MKKLIAIFSIAVLMSSCYVQQGLPCPCMHCEKNIGKHKPMTSVSPIVKKIKR